MNAFTFTILVLVMVLLQEDCKNYTVAALAGSCPRSLINLKTNVRTKVNLDTMLPKLNQAAMGETSAVEENSLGFLQKENNSVQTTKPNLIKRAFIRWMIRKKLKEPLENLATFLSEAKSMSTNKGIRLSYLLNEFVEECGGREALKGLTTKDVFQQFILPITTNQSKLYLALNQSNAAESFLEEHNPIDMIQQFVSKECKLSYCDMVLSNQTSKASTDDAVFDSNVLILSLSDHIFLDVLDVLACHFKDKPNVIIWFDLFSLNQIQYMTTNSIMGDPDPEWWLKTFSNEVVKKMNHTYIYNTRLLRL